MLTAFDILLTRNTHGRKAEPDSITLTGPCHQTTQLKSRVAAVCSLITHLPARHVYSPIGWIIEFGTEESCRYTIKSHTIISSGLELSNLGGSFSSAPLNEIKMAWLRGSSVLVARRPFANTPSPRSNSVSNHSRRQLGSSPDHWPLPWHILRSKPTRRNVGSQK
jgi:hypothetical protein